MRATLPPIALAVGLIVCQTAGAYGPIGHEIVGGIADQLLEHKPAGAKIHGLIDGISLQKAAVMPDEIKAWDKKGPDDPNAFPHYSQHPEIDRQLRDFWRANPPNPDPNSTTPSHHWFHYTDVPVFEAKKYSEGKVGRSKWDVVHMISYCVSVLKGETPENNDRKITKPIAVILLAHYVGDIHQPLHVGAEYFDNSGHAIEPEKASGVLADEGGNTMALRLNDDPAPHRGVHVKKLHGFWDMDAVTALLPEVPAWLPKGEKKTQIEATQGQLIKEMAAQEPKDWRMRPQVELKDYAEAWADEILPIARDAHERLQFDGVKPLQEDSGRIVASGDAVEKANADQVSYRDWAKKIVRVELHKAGWRLADLLEKSVTGSNTVSPSASKPRPKDVESAATPQSAASPAVAAAPSATPASPPAANKISLTKPVKVRVPYGEVVLPAGMTLPVISRDATTVKVKYMDGAQPIPASSTVDVIEPAR